MLNHEQNNGGLPWVIYQQHSVPVAVVAVAAEMDFLAEVHVDATVALWSSSFSSAAVAVAITTDVAAVAAAAMIAAAANSGFTIIHKRDIGQKGCPVSTEGCQQKQFCWYFF